MCTGCNQTPCGDLYDPPSRNNLSLLAIIELVVMLVVAILCAIELVTFFNKGGSFDTIGTLMLIDDILIVAAVCYIISGLFCAFSGNQMKIGILLFVIGGILAMVIIVLQLSGTTNSNVLYKILQFILFLYLTWILWNQAARL